MLVKESDGSPIEPVHKMGAYITTRLKDLGWLDKDLVAGSGISKGHISKLKNKTGEKLTAFAFYSIYKAFGDTCSDAAKQVYPDLNLSLDSYTPKKRNEFGAFMLQFEESKNSPEEVAAKTGIDENRIKDIYFRKGAAVAYELLLIEKAVGKELGELFEKFHKDKTGSR